MKVMKYKYIRGFPCKYTAGTLQSIDSIKADTEEYRRLIISELAKLWFEQILG